MAGMTERTSAVIGFMQPNSDLRAALKDISLLSYSALVELQKN
jgi:hypothetical protein